MLRFKEFLLEAPAPPNIKELQDYVYDKEAGGNEDVVLGLHGGPTDPTIGFGHSLQDKKRSKEKFNRLFPELNADDVFSGKSKITREQAQTLFDDDTNDQIKKLRGIIPNLDDYTPEAQKGLYSSSFRGVLGGSPNAVSLLNAGKYDEAADELLNNDEYRKSKAGIPIKGRLLPGIAKRMEEESALIRGESARRNNNISLTGKVLKTAVSVLPKVIDTVTKLAEPIGGFPTEPKNNTPASPVTDNDHTIQSGETLWKLTKGDPAKIKQIQAANPGLNPDKLSVGQKIKIPR